MQTPDVTKNQITGLLTPLATAAVTFGLVSNEKAAIISTAAATLLGLGLFVSDAIIRAKRAHLHGTQLLLYAVAKVEALHAQGVDVNKVLGPGPALAVTGVDVTTPPVADTHPQPGDVDYIPPPDPATAAPPPPPAPTQPPATMGASVDAPPADAAAPPAAPAQ